MPQLEWDEQDFLQYLAVIPEVEDYEVSHTYRVTQGGIALQLTLWQLESMVQVSLYREGAVEPMTSFGLAVRGPVRYRSEKWGEYLEFHDCVLVAGRFSYIQMGDLFDEGRYPRGLRMLLSVYPEIQAKLSWH